MSNIGEHPSREMRMPREMGLGVCLLLLLVVLTGATPVSAEPLVKLNITTIGFFNPQWLTSLVSGSTAGSPASGDRYLNTGVEMNLWKAVGSGVVLLVCLYIILYRPEDDKARKWAFGVVSIILLHILL
jgi:hypothetical protein